MITIQHFYDAFVNEKSCLVSRWLFCTKEINNGINYVFHIR